MHLRFQLGIVTLAGLLIPLVLRSQVAPEGGALDSLLQQGAAALQRGDLALAESDFRKATESSPRSGEAYMGLGLAELRDGSSEGAVASLRKAASVSPNLGGAHLFLGIAQYQTGNPEEAAASLRQELALNPHNLEALTWMGIVELGSGHPEEATGPLDQAAVLAPKDSHLLYYRARAHSLVAEATYRQLYEQEPDSALVHRALAESLAGSGQPEKSIAEYELALKKEPTNADLYEGLGEQNQKLSRFDEARVAYQEELKLNPSSGIALYNLGKMDIEAGKAESGVAFLRKAEAAHVAGAATDYYLGLGLAQTGSYAESAHWLEQALANQPSSFVEQGALFQLGRVYQRLGRRGDAQRAIDRLKELKAHASPGAVNGASSVSGLAVPPTTGRHTGSQ